MKRFLCTLLVAMLVLCSTAVAEDWICPSCGSTVSGNFCNNCGSAKPSDEWVCPSCNNKTSGNFCNNCGSPKPEQEKTPLLSGDGWEIVKEYKYSAGFGDSEFYGFVLKNTTDKNKILTGQVLYYDSADNLIGVSEIFKTVVASQYTIFCSTYNDAPFDHAVVVPVLKTPTSSFSLDPFMDINTSRVGNKLIITVKNNSEFNADSVSYEILYFDENDRIVNTSSGYFDEIPAGGQGIMEDPPSYSQVPFSYAEVYISAIHF